MNSIERLLELLKEDIERFHDDSKAHKRLYRRTQTTVIVLSAVTTVAAGAGLILPTATDSYIQFAVLVLSAATTAVTAWLEMRRARELWQHEREMYYQLFDVQREIKFYSAHKTLTSSEVEDYFKRVSSILGASVGRWMDIADGSQQK